MEKPSTLEKWHQCIRNVCQCRLVSVRVAAQCNGTPLTKMAIYEKKFAKFDPSALERGACVLLPGFAWLFCSEIDSP